MSEPADDRVWERGWAGHEQAQLRRLSRLSLALKLEWLEDAHRFVRRVTGAGRAPSPVGSSRSDRKPPTS